MRSDKPIRVQKRRLRNKPLPSATMTMLSRVSRQVARRSPRAVSAASVEARRSFVHPSSSNRASVIDPPPPAVRESDDLFRPRAGKIRLTDLNDGMNSTSSDMLGFKLDAPRRDSNGEKARPIYLDMQVRAPYLRACCTAHKILLLRLLPPSTLVCWMQ